MSEKDKVERITDLMGKDTARIYELTQAVTRLTRERDDLLAREKQNEKYMESVHKHRNLILRERDEARKLLEEIREEHDDDGDCNSAPPCRCTWCEKVRVLELIVEGFG